MASFFFKVSRVRLFHGLSLLPPSISCLSVTQPPPFSFSFSLSFCRESFLFLFSTQATIPRLVCPSLCDGRYSTLLPSNDDYLCLQAKREMKAKLFGSAFRLSELMLSLFTFDSFFLALSSFLCHTCPLSLCLFVFAVSLFVSSRSSLCL